MRSMSSRGIEDTRERARFSVRRFLTWSRVMAAVWFVAAFAGVVFTWGKDPRTFVSPDEAVNRLAALLTSENGRPFLSLPFTDQEDLAHPRFWVTLGDHAVPAYSPLAFYLYAALIKVPLIGLWLIPALPASGVAAFTLGTARLLPASRRWLALLSPVLGFPALYWLLRPWMNISLLLVCISWAFLFWVIWHESLPGKVRTRWLLAAFALVGAGAATRPDYSAYLVLAALLFALAESKGEWKLVMLSSAGALAGAVLLNLLLNWFVTGQPLRAAYQIYVSRLPEDGTSTFLPGLLNSVLTPVGLRTPREIWGFFVKYALDMRPLGLLVIGQASLVPLLYPLPRRKRFLYLAAIAVVMCLAVTRLSDDVWGGKVSAGYVHHSVPRYLTPVYLLASLPPILFLGRGRFGVTTAFGTVLACILAVRSGYEICVHQPDSLKYLRKGAEKDRQMIRSVTKSVPEHALVYTATYDKVLWSRWRVAQIGEPKATAASMSRGVAADIPVFVVEPRFGGSKFSALEKALKRKRLGLDRVDAKRGVYRVRAVGDR
jgi:hypothetical protein